MRALQPVERTPGPVTAFDADLPARARAMLAETPTLFVASASGADAHDGAAGLDISHRGGPAGFARLDGYSIGVALRGTASGGRTLHRTAGAYAWGPGNKPYVAVGTDVLALDLEGKITKIYPGAVAGGADDMAISPDGRFAAVLAAHVLTAVAL